MPSIESATDVPAGRYLFFGVAGRLCACDLGLVREIVPARDATRLPGAPAWVIGLVNLRGTLLTVVDLAQRFGATTTGVRTIIVVEAAGRVLGLGVDAVRDVQPLAPEVVESVDLSRSAGGIVRGLARLDGATVEVALVCDVEAIVRQALVV